VVRFSDTPMTSTFPFGFAAEVTFCIATSVVAAKVMSQMAFGQLTALGVNGLPLSSVSVPPHS
jgi:hypothetical protein